MQCGGAKGIDMQGSVPNRCDIYSRIILAGGIVSTNSKIISNNNAWYFILFNVISFPLVN